MTIHLTKIQSINAGGKGNIATSLNVSSFELTENEIIIHHFDGSGDERCELRSNDGIHNDDWEKLNIFIDRSGLHVTL